MSHPRPPSQPGPERRKLNSSLQDPEPLFSTPKVCAVEFQVLRREFSLLTSGHSGLKWRLTEQWPQFVFEYLAEVNTTDSMSASRAGGPQC